MAFFGVCNICKANKMMVPGQFICYECFPEVYKKRLDIFSKKISKLEQNNEGVTIDELKYLLEHSHLAQPREQEPKYGVKIKSQEE